MSLLAQETEGTTPHPLLTRKIRPVHDWPEWLERWGKAETYPEMIGLLHMGFNVSLDSFIRTGKDYSHADRLRFYFAVADGWADSVLLRSEEFRGRSEVDTLACGVNERGIVRKTESELRQDVAQKAFDMLCANFFKHRAEPNSSADGRQWRENWMEDLAAGHFALIMDFFRPRRDSLGIKIRNLRNYRNVLLAHREKIVRDFLIQFVNAIWELEPPSSDKPKEHLETVRQTLAVAKPWSIFVLEGLRELPIARKWIFQFDERALAALTEIAMNPGFRISYRNHDALREDSQPINPRNLEEACYIGGTAAWILKEHEILTGVERRLDGIAEARRVRDEANKKLRDLNK